MSGIRSTNELIVTPEKKKKVGNDILNAPKKLQNKENKTQKIHSDKASQYEEGYTKTEDGVDYIVKNKKWLVVKPPKLKRAPTAYSIFLGNKMKELRIEEPGKPSTYYMSAAVLVWKQMSDEEKAQFKKD